MNNQTPTANGIGVSGLLGIAFVVLKLMGYITWSWWWVTFPFWGSFAIALIVILAIIIAVYTRHNN